jgi:hypothetical protein
MVADDEFGFCRSHLVNGEYILWKGKPQEGNFLLPSDLYMIPFSILWCAGAIFWEYSVVSHGAPLLFCLFGIPFVGMGLYLVIGRFLWAAWIRKRTRYVITNKKIIRARGHRIDMMDGRTMPPVQIHVFGNGCGTLFFVQINPYHRGGYVMNNTWPGTGCFALENVESPAQIQQALASMDR